MSLMYAQRRGCCALFDEVELWVDDELGRGVPSGLDC